MGCIYFSKKRKLFEDKIAYMKLHANKNKGVILECKKEFNWLGTSIYPYKYSLVIKSEQGETVKTDYLLDIASETLVGRNVYFYINNNDVYLDPDEIDKTREAI